MRQYEIGDHGMRKAFSIVALILMVALLMGCTSSTEDGSGESTDKTDKNTEETTAKADEKPFYDGKTIKLIVSTKPGGGYDTYGRMVAKFMEEQLPGSTIVVKNMPGAGHIIGCNEIYKSEPDGLTFGTFNRALPLAQIAGLEGVEYDLSEMSWLGSPSSESYSLIISSESEYSSLDDIVKAGGDVILASSGVGSQAHVTSLLFADMMGWDKMNLVSGYNGNESELAMRKGEIDGLFASWGSLQSFVEEGYGVPVLFIGEQAPEGYEDVPLIQDVVTDEQWTPVVNVMLTLNVLARPYAGPPGIPEDRLSILRDAFEKAVNDPAFVEMGDKLGRPVIYIGPERAQELISGLADLSPATVDKIKSTYTGDE